MKNAFAILKRDLRKIFTNSMAIVLVIGLIALPSLYAWFNIYANWDPYGKTGNMMVAVCNEDEGANYKELEINVGEEIVNNLKGNDAINWQFVSKEKAVKGVESGKYYAAIEIPSGFSANLSSIVTNNYKQPHIIYYANEKKNAIATKITDKVVQTVQASVNESFITTVVNIMGKVLGVAMDEDNAITGGNTFDYLKKEIKSTQTTVSSLSDALNSFNDLMKVVKSLNVSLDEKDIGAALNNCNTLIDDVEDTVKVTQSAVDTIFSSVGTIMSSVSTSLDSLATSVDKIGDMNASDAMAALANAKAEINSLKQEIDDIKNILVNVNNSLQSPIPELTSLINRLNNISSSLGSISNAIDTVTGANYKEISADIASKIRGVSSSIKTAQNDYKTNIEPKLTKSVNTLLTTLGSLSNIVDKLSGDVPSINTLVSTIKQSAKAGDDMITAISKLLNNTDGQLTKLYNEIDALSNSELVNSLVNITGENAEHLGDFLACPVKVETEKVYAIENYGSAMAPFYSTLAIWVGAMFLVAVIKINIKNKKEIASKLTSTQSYFGRGMLFVLFAIVQSFIILAGDLWFLNIQCYHPIKFILAGLLGGVVFSMFIYSLVFTLGDLGKAIGVILLVIQIGGSGGTFPIDVTQQFFVWINPYLPFTFVIEAMRECICGEYGANYWIYLLKLLAYAVASLIIGIPLKYIVKKPIKFFEKSIEKTGLF